METINIFENISEHIIQHIRGAENAIYICVPWLTDSNILQELVEKSRNKVHVEIITLNDDSNRTKTSYFNKLISNGSKVYLIDKTIDGGIPHHKFCIIDDELLITGSYNWSNNAKKNDENIIIKIINDFEDHNIINDYNIQFNKLLYKYGIKKEDDDWDAASEYVTSAIVKQEEARKYFDLAHSLLLENKALESLEYINEGINKLPYPSGDFYWLKYIILKHLRRYLDCADQLFNYLSEISDDDDSIETFKNTYKDFVKAILEDGHETYKIISELNQKTKIKLGKFALLKIEPHFFTFDELDMLPF